VPYRVQLDGLQILWLLANPLWTHGIGESGSKTSTSWLLMGAVDANLIWWVNTKAFTGLLLHLNSYRKRHLPFWLLEYVFLLIALSPVTK
jgi:hypothetical protein